MDGTGFVIYNFFGDLFWMRTFSFEGFFFRFIILLKAKEWLLSLELWTSLVDLLDYASFRGLIS